MSTMIEPDLNVLPSEYELEVIPYSTDTLEPIPSPDGYNLGMVRLP